MFNRLSGLLPRDILAFGVVTIIVYHGLIALLRLALFSLSKWPVSGAENIPSNAA